MTVPPRMPPPAKKIVCTAPQWSRPAPVYDSASVVRRGVRPNSLPMTIKVLSSRPWEDKSSMSAHNALSVGGKSLSRSRTKMSPWVSQVSLFLSARVGAGYVECAADAGVGKERDRRLAVFVEGLRCRGVLQVLPLLVELPEELETAVQAVGGHAWRQGDVGRLKNAVVGGLRRIP